MKLMCSGHNLTKKFIYIRKVKTDINTIINKDKERLIILSVVGV